MQILQLQFLLICYSSSFVLTLALKSRFGYLIGYDTSMYLGLFWPIIKFAILGIIAVKNDFEPNPKLIYKKIYLK